jgi:hypothetical protein
MHKDKIYSIIKQKSVFKEPHYSFPERKEGISAFFKENYEFILRSRLLINYLSLGLLNSHWQGKQQSVLQQSSGLSTSYCFIQL